MRRLCRNLRFEHRDARIDRRRCTPGAREAQIQPHAVGLFSFVIQSLWDGDLVDVVVGTIPFHLIMFVLLLMLVIWPDLALWLPARMSTGP
jgi:hypothetical protein